MRIMAICTALLAMTLAACGADVVNIKVVETGQAGGMAINFPGMASFGQSLGKALSKKDVNPKDVDSMKVRGVTLELTSQGGLTDDLSFIESLQFMVSAEGMEPQVLASKASFSDGDLEVEMQMVEGLELKPFLSAGSMRIDLHADLAFPPPDVVELQVTFRIRVDVDVI